MDTLENGRGSAYLVWGRNVIMKLNLNNYDAGKCVFVQVPRHEEVYESGGTVPSFFTPALNGQSGQLHAPAALTPGKEPPIPIR
jgi:hypothetical protein